MTTTRTPSAAAAATTRGVQTYIKRTYQITRDYGRLMVDRWKPLQPSGATPVLLVHGWGGTGNYWDMTAQFLAQTVPVIVPDLPGTGRSQPVHPPRNMYDQVDTLLDVLDTLELDRVQIVSHSMGSAMSTLLAAAHPERVERLVLTSMVFFRTQEQIDFYNNMMKVFHVAMRFRPSWLVNVPGMTKLMGDQYFYEMPDDPALLRQGLRDYLELDRATALACADNATDEAIRDAGYNVQAPTLLIACQNDNMMPLDNVEFTLDIIPDSRVRWIDECGHLPMVEKPATYQAILRDFLAL